MAAAKSPTRISELSKLYDKLKALSPNDPFLQKYPDKQAWLNQFTPQPYDKERQ